MATQLQRGGTQNWSLGRLKPELQTCSLLPHGLANTLTGAGATACMTVPRVCTYSPSPSLHGHAHSKAQGSPAPSPWSFDTWRDHLWSEAPGCWDFLPSRGWGGRFRLSHESARVETELRDSSLCQPRTQAPAPAHRHLHPRDLAPTGLPQSPFLKHPEIPLHSPVPTFPLFCFVPFCFVLVSMPFP